jgi:hypothetical protein
LETVSALSHTGQHSNPTGKVNPSHCLVDSGFLLDYRRRVPEKWTNSAAKEQSFYWMGFLPLGKTLGKTTLLHPARAVKLSGW